MYYSPRNHRESTNTNGNNMIDSSPMVTGSEIEYIKNSTMIKRSPDPRDQAHFSNPKGRDKGHAYFNANLDRENMISFHPVNPHPETNHKKKRGTGNRSNSKQNKISFQKTNSYRKIAENKKALKEMDKFNGDIDNMNYAKAIKSDKSDRHYESHHNLRNNNNNTNRSQIKDSQIEDIIVKETPISLPKSSININEPTFVNSVGHSQSLPKFGTSNMVDSEIVSSTRGVKDTPGFNDMQLNDSVEYVRNSVNESRRTDNTTHMSNVSKPFAKRKKSTGHGQQKVHEIEGIVKSVPEEIIDFCMNDLKC